MSDNKEGRLERQYVYCRTLSYAFVECRIFFAGTHADGGNFEVLPTIAPIVEAANGTRRLTQWLLKSCLGGADSAFGNAEVEWKLLRMAGKQSGGTCPPMS